MVLKVIELLGDRRVNEGKEIYEECVDKGCDVGRSVLGTRPEEVPAQSVPVPTTKRDRQASGSEKHRELDCDWARSILFSSHTAAVVAMTSKQRNPTTVNEVHIIFRFFLMSK